MRLFRQLLKPLQFYSWRKQLLGQYAQSLAAYSGFKFCPTYTRILPDARNRPMPLMVFGLMVAQCLKSTDDDDNNDKKIGKIIYGK